MSTSQTSNSENNVENMMEIWQAENACQNRWMETHLVTPVEFMQFGVAKLPLNHIFKCIKL